MLKWAGLVRAEAYAAASSPLLSMRWLGDALPTPLRSEHTRAFGGRCPSCVSRVRLDTRTQKNPPAQLLPLHDLQIKEQGT